MNNTKRGLELAAAIITIIVSSIMVLGAFVLLSNLNTLEDQVHQAEIDILKGAIIFLLVISVVMIVFGTILCANPVKNGVYKPRVGISITLLVLLGLVAVLEIESPLYFAFFATPFGLLLASLCMKQPKTEEKDNKEGISFQPQEFNLNNNLNSDFDEQLRKLKDLRDMGVLDEEQYKQAVDKIINSL